jgi:secretory phospholipase A2
MKVQTTPEMVPCCDVHDICYDTCGSSKKKCDEDFQACLLKTCVVPSFGTKEDCENTASVLSVGVNAFGCAAFKRSQKKACHCQPAAAGTHEDL